MNLETLVARVDERMRLADQEEGVLWVSPNVALAGRLKMTAAEFAIIEAGKARGSMPV